MALREFQAVEEARVAKKLVVVALVVVELTIERLVIDEEALMTIPMLVAPLGVMTEMSVVVAHLEVLLPPPEPQAVPVFEMSPIEEKVAQPAVPPAEETMRLVVEAVVAESEVVVALVNKALVKVPRAEKKEEVEVAEVRVVEPEPRKFGTVTMPVLLMER